MFGRRDGLIERLRRRRLLREQQHSGFPAETEGSSTAAEELEEAKKHLEKFAGLTKCPWCKRKGKAIANLTEELKNLTPIAEEFNRIVGNLEEGKIQKLGEEISTMKKTIEQQQSKE